MTVFEALLIVTVLLCSLVAGFLYAFAVVVMPGLKSLNNGEFVKAFQVMDGVIQRNQPFFVLVWAGSILSFISLVVLACFELATARFLYLLASMILYLLGVQLPTGIINVPLNNALQKHNVDQMDESQLREARTAFEGNWNRSNVFRTVVSVLVSVSLLLFPCIA